MPLKGQKLDVCKTCKHSIKHHGLVDEHTGCLYFHCSCEKFIKLARCRDCNNTRSMHDYAISAGGSLSYCGGFRE